MSAAARKRRACLIADACSCGCGVLCMPNRLQWTGRYGAEHVTFATTECFVRFLEQKRAPAEAVCECGAPTAKQCECSDEAQEVDSNETLGLRR